MKDSNQQEQPSGVKHIDREWAATHSADLLRLLEQERAAHAETRRELEEYKAEIEPLLTRLATAEGSRDGLRDRLAAVEKENSSLRQIFGDYDFHPTYEQCVAIWNQQRNYLVAVEGALRSANKATRALHDAVMVVLLSIPEADYVTYVQPSLIEVEVSLRAANAVLAGQPAERTEPEPREGIVMVYDWQHKYLGCMGLNRWTELLAEDAERGERTEDSR